MQKKKRVLTKFLTVIVTCSMLIGSISGCSGTAPDKESRTNDLLTVALSADPGTLSPIGMPTDAFNRIAVNIYDTPLVMSYDTSEVSGLLVTEYGWADDNHYEMTIRDGVKFHDGSVMKAEDVLFSIELANTVATIARNMTGIDWENCKVIDDKHISIAFTKREALAEYIFTVVHVVPKAAYEANPQAFIDNPIGSGPYKAVKYTLGDSVALERFDDYWGDKAKIKNVKLRFISEANQRIVELESGGVDLVFDASGRDITRLSGDEKYTANTRETGSMVNLMMNNSVNSACRDKKVRQAIAYAIDAVGLVENVYQGLAVVPAGYLPASCAYFNPDVNGSILYPQDLDKSKTLLAEAGYPDGLELTCFIDETSDRKAAAEIIQFELSKAGIKVNFQTYENAVRLDMIKDPACGWDLTLSLYNVASPITSTNMYVSSAGNAIVRYENEAFEELFKEIKYSSDDATLKKLFAEAQEIIREDLPFYSYASRRNAVAHISGLKGFHWWGNQFSRFSSCYF